MAKAAIQSLSISRGSGMRNATFGLRLMAAIVGVIAACSHIHADPPGKPGGIRTTETPRILPARDPERPCAVLETGSCSPDLSARFTGENWSGFFSFFQFEMNLLLPPRDF
jgi:hypothetical protein